MTRWVTKSVVLAIHEQQIAEHGGAPGVRDIGLLESALARPENLASYGEPDVAAMASSYAFGIARNHPFLDGNKRTSYVVTKVFLRLNGRDVEADEATRLQIWLDLAAGDLTEEQLTNWLRSNLVKI
ncbi:MAG: death on curing protein [Alphaproteobacteria bacterium]|nr:death on curing protein [Alphaproteobacteria bacterium]